MTTTATAMPSSAFSAHMSAGRHGVGPVAENMTAANAKQVSGAAPFSRKNWQRYSDAMMPTPHRPAFPLESRAKPHPSAEPSTTPIILFLPDRTDMSTDLPMESTVAMTARYGWSSFRRFEKATQMVTAMPVLIIRSPSFRSERILWKTLFISHLASFSPKAIAAICSGFSAR